MFDLNCENTEFNFFNTVGYSSENMQIMNELWYEFVEDASFEENVLLDIVAKIILEIGA